MPCSMVGQAVNLPFDTANLNKEHLFFRLFRILTTECAIMNLSLLRKRSENDPSNWDYNGSHVGIDAFGRDDNQI